MIKLRGIDNINLDLMYAIPKEKLSTVKKDITKLLSLFNYSIELKIIHII